MDRTTAPGRNGARWQALRGTRVEVGDLASRTVVATALGVHGTLEVTCFADGTTPQFDIVEVPPELPPPEQASPTIAVEAANAMTTSSARAPATPDEGTLFNTRNDTISATRT